MRALTQRLILTLGLGTALLAGAERAEAQGSYRVIVNSANPVSVLPKSDLSAIFLRKRVNWQGGSNVQPVDLSERSAVRESFTRDVHGKPVTAVKAYWNQMVFSGRSVPPPEKSSDQEVVEFVRRNQNAIGYVSASARLDGVKVVAIGS